MIYQKADATESTLEVTHGFGSILLTANEVAQKLRLTNARVYELARRHQIPCVRIGRQVRFDNNQLRTWIEQGGSYLKEDGEQKAE